MSSETRWPAGHGGWFVCVEEKQWWALLPGLYRKEGEEADNERHRANRAIRRNVAEWARQQGLGSDFGRERFVIPACGEYSIGFCLCVGRRVFQPQLRQFALRQNPGIQR